MKKISLFLFALVAVLALSSDANAFFRPRTVIVNNNFVPVARAVPVAPAFGFRTRFVPAFGYGFTNAAFTVPVVTHVEVDQFGFVHVVDQFGRVVR